MKFSETWLRTLVDSDLPTEKLAHLLTMAGLEVEECVQIAPPFTAVVVAQVLTVTKHPDADRLNVCSVDIGTGTPQQIVCGAPNVAPGLKVPCALPGAVLPGGFTIKLAKVRGIESAGMLCSAKELGLTESSEGLLVLPSDAPTGTPIRTYLDLDDSLLTLKLTPNRADCLSLIGIAREVAALTGKETHFPGITVHKTSINEQRTIHLNAESACPRYCGQVVVGVNAAAATPDWMLRRLERSGLRSISALVDITNYVLLEQGQPLHAFDHQKLQGDISVRFAQPGESLLLLNGQNLSLTEEMLVIADEQAPQALAGIMGGANSAVSDTTDSVFIESAFFAPEAIAGRPRKCGIHSDSAHRFERGVDFSATRDALNRAVNLILEICGGQAGPISESLTTLPKRPAVTVRTERINRVLGLALTPEAIAALFYRMGIPFTQSDKHFTLTPPAHRFDLVIEEDFIEEVARIHGYDEIPAQAPHAPISMLPYSESHRPRQQIAHWLANRGYQEVINFAFVEETWERNFAQVSGKPEPIRLANPIASHLSVLRTSLLGGMVNTLQTNLRHKQDRVRIFEIGRVFLRSDNSTENAVPGYHQPWKLGILISGTAKPESWSDPARPVDFFDLKNDVCALLAPKSLVFKKAIHPALHPGRSAEIYLGEQSLGLIGELHPEWVQKYGLTSPPIVLEIDLSPLESTCPPAFTPFSRQPSVTRDLAVILDQEQSLDTVLAALTQTAPPWVQGINLFDLYTGKGIPKGKKSLAFRIVMQDTERTLQDSEVDAVVTQLMHCLQSRFSAEQRT